MGDVSYVSLSAASARLKRAQNPIIVVIGSKTAQVQIVSSVVQGICMTNISHH